MRPALPEHAAAPARPTQAAPAPVRSILKRPETVEAEKAAERKEAEKASARKRWEEADFSGEEHRVYGCAANPIKDLGYVSGEESN